MNGILILVNNLFYFDAFLSNLDNRIKNYKLFIINETRVDDKIEEIHHRLKHSQVNCYEIIDSKTITNEFKKIIDTTFVDSYTMSMNVLGVWYIFKNLKINKLLILDDDIILKNNYDDIFKFTSNSFCVNNVFTVPKLNLLSKNALTFYKEFFNIFNLNIDDEWEYYKKNYMNSGQRLIVRNEFNYGAYEYYLKKLFSSKTIESFWNKRKNHISWFIDERFINLFFVKLNHSLNNNLNTYTNLIIKRVEKINKSDLNKANKASILHICNGKTKINTYNLLIEKEIIKGEKYDNKNY